MRQAIVTRYLDTVVRLQAAETPLRRRSLERRLRYLLKLAREVR